MRETPALDAAVIADSERRVVFWSTAAERMFGVPADHAVGCSIQSFFDQWPDAARRADGTHFQAEVREEPWSGFDGGVSVITIRERTNDVEREELQRQLEEARRISTLGRVAATMAHEFNNVMMGIGTFVEVLKRRTTPESVTRAVRGISSSIDRGRTITDEILRYTKSVRPSLALIDVKRWLLGDFAHEAEELTKGTAIVRSEDDLHIRGDVTQLTQVLVNLLLNARDASAPGAPIAIDATCANHETTVMITVTDQGSGMSETTRERIFDPLFTTKQRGTGLGLAIVQQVIAAHGGTIRVESEIGHGSTFRIALPAVDTQPKQSAQPRRSAIVTEDDAGVAAGIAALLMSEGMTVRTASTGREALDEIARSRPDLIILDMRLPDMQGPRVYGLVERLWPALPVIFISSAAEPREVAEYLEKPYAAFLAKPFDIDELMEAIARILDGR